MTKNVNSKSWTFTGSPRATYESGNLSGAGIFSTSGTIADGETITISGSGFGIKTEPRPALWWSADTEGTGNPSALGVVQTWQQPFNPNTEVTTVVTAPNSAQAVRSDIFVNSQPMPYADFTATGEFYVWRKKYDDFDVTLDYGVRLITTGKTGEYTVGRTLTGGTSGAVGTINKVSGDTVYLDNTSGTFDQFQNGETLTESVSGITSVVDSLSLGFNNKTIRFWKTGWGENLYIHRGAASNLPNGADIVSRAISEYAGASTYWFGSSPTHVAQQEAAWEIEEFSFKDSDIDVQNGEVSFWVDNYLVFGPSDRLFRTRTTEYPALKGRVAQSQVSNGVQPNSYQYYDSLYIDNSLHRVLIGDASTYNACTKFEVQIPKTSWTDNQLHIQVRQGDFTSLIGKYLYVVNSTGEPVSEGGYIL